MKYILIIFISILSLNYSFGQMKVYVGTDTYNQRNLVGIIYESGEVYKYSNGVETLWGIVRNNKFYYFGKDNSEVLIGFFDNVPTMGGGGRIYFGTGTDSMAGFVYGGRYYYGQDIEDKSKMLGFHSNDWNPKVGGGKYFAAYFLLLDAK